MIGVVCGCVVFCSSCVVCFGVCGSLSCVRRVAYIVMCRVWCLVVSLCCLCVVCWLWFGVCYALFVAYRLSFGVCCSCIVV